MKNLFLYAIVAITFLSCGTPEPKNGEELIQSMHEKYNKDWYQTLTFEQATIYYNQSGEVIREQTWFEAMELPSSLAIKFDSITSGTGIVFKNDSVSNFRNGLKVSSRKFYHPLLILGFSVYAQNPEKTTEDLSKLNIDLSKIKTSNWQGKENYVVGDEKGTHFYIEKERLLFTKMVQFGSNNSVSETQFNKYEPLQNGWISPEVLFFTNGKMTMKEVYSDIKTPILGKEVFDLTQFEKAKW
ncbi:MAG: hypothetical protein P8I51_03660 [Polaribacter sp.]|jgi:hypothetical protein|nr:hypothetical protein [Polaribacter sp.]MDG1953973.1 hypothetical protein [Polaribacter sp.]MDG2074795.1 hypothetical protein [Polaribacter sp.]